MGEVAASLVPWVENKLILSSSWIKTKRNIRRRVREYAQLICWTKSSLQVSTVFDWGHTCDLAGAINNCASLTLGDITGEFCWAFTSRTLLSKFLSYTVDHCLWLKIVHRIASPDFVVHTTGSSHQRLTELVLFEGEKNTFKAQFISSWILYSSFALDEWRRFYESHLYLRSFGQLQAISESWRLLDDRNVLRRERVAAERAVRILESALFTFYTAVLERCCEADQESLRQRALRFRSCGGPSIRFERSRYYLRFDAAGWHHMRTMWISFIENWSKIVARASEWFPFPQDPAIADYVFHDMATGYVASSAMLRRGGKFSDSTGTTIVHPGERAAVVSAACKVLSMKDSTISKNGLRREWSSAAQEFARYALIRCDLVKRSRMSFRDAVEDWESQYTCWDRAPTRYSEWANNETYDFIADDYRIVLLRQALGKMRSIDIYAALGTECSTFGGFLAVVREYEVSQREEKVLVVDQPLTITATVYVNPLKGPFQIILDTWGSRVEGYKCEDAIYYEKCCLPSGRPGILKLTTNAQNVGLEGASGILDRVLTFA